MKVLLPTGIRIDPRPRPGVEFVTYDPHHPIPEEHTDAEVLVAWGNRSPQLADAARRLPRLRLVQALAAGPDFFARAGFAPGVFLATGVGLHDIAVAEHSLMLSLALARRLPDMLRAQAQHRWATDLGWSAETTSSADARGLYGKHVVIWGFGHIGQHLAPMLAALGASVTGVARVRGNRAGFNVVGEDDVNSVLPGADQLIMILPNSPSTYHMLDAAKLALLPRHCQVINVGRGATIDADALAEALRKGELAGAGLDVFEKEPLPSDSPLWDLPGVIITPHAAGGRPIGIEDLLDAQIDALTTGGELRNRWMP